MHSYISFKRQYEAYVSHEGDPWSINPLTLSQDFRAALKRHYKKPPKDRLTFIDEYRYRLSGICLMCGSEGNHTLDHYLPQTKYPEFSFFSNNLVPACGCNSLRGDAVKGDRSPKRPIHPYFDTFLGRRLYQAVFSGDFETPSITLKLVDSHDPNKDTLQYHLEEVLLNKLTLGKFESWWADLSRRPHQILKDYIPDGQVSQADTLDAIERYRNSKDVEHDTPNNWKSMFYTGLLDDISRMNKLANSVNSLRL